MKVHTVDARGRVTIGAKFAGRLVYTIPSDDRCELVIKLIPKREEWLYRNKKALTAVYRGLKQAKELSK